MCVAMLCAVRWVSGRTVCMILEDDQIGAEVANACHCLMLQERGRR
jgi:hypothetical protein